MIPTPVVALDVPKRSVRKSPPEALQERILALVDQLIQARLARGVPDGVDDARKVIAFAVGSLVPVTPQFREPARLKEMSKRVEVSLFYQRALCLRAIAYQAAQLPGLSEQAERRRIALRLAKQLTELCPDFRPLIDEIPDLLSKLERYAARPKGKAGRIGAERLLAELIVEGGYCLGFQIEPGAEEADEIDRIQKSLQKARKELKSLQPD